MELEKEVIAMIIAINPILRETLTRTDAFTGYSIRYSKEAFSSNTFTHQAKVNYQFNKKLKNNSLSPELLYHIKRKRHNHPEQF